MLLRVNKGLSLWILQLFDAEGRGSLSAEELSDLMGALLDFPQRHTAELYAQASAGGRLTEGEGLQARRGL